MIRWLVLVTLFVAAGMLGLAIVNADQSNVLAPLVVVVVASLALGWGTGTGWAAVVPLILIPLALPFGDTNKFTGGDDTDPVWWDAVELAVISALFILIAVGGRHRYDRRRRAGRTSKA